MSQPTQPGALVNEKTALAAGLLATVFALFLAFAAAKQVLDIAGDLIGLGIGLYVLGMFVQYWTAQSYRDGLTAKEATMAVVWPVDMFKTIREGVNRQQLASNFKGAHLSTTHDTSKTLVNEKVALFGGIIATAVVCLPLLFWSIGSVIGVAFQLIWLGILIYCVGFVVNFWISTSYKNGLTQSEIVLNALWPIDILKKIRAGVARRQLIP